MFFLILNLGWAENVRFWDDMFPGIRSGFLLRSAYYAAKENTDSSFDQFRINDWCFQWGTIWPKDCHTQ